MIRPAGKRQLWTTCRRRRTPVGWPAECRARNVRDRARLKAGTRRPSPEEYQPRMGSVSPRCRLHLSPAGQFQPCRSRYGRGRPVQDCAELRRAPPEPRDQGGRQGGDRGSPPSISSMMSMLRDARSSSTERRCSRRRVKRSVAVMFGSPSRDVAVVDYLDLPGLCMTHPHEGAALAGLAPTVELSGVVRDRRPEIRTPRTLAVIAVGARDPQGCPRPA